MNRFLKLLAGAAAMAYGATLIVLGDEAPLLSLACENSRLGEVHSPDGKYKAIVFHRTCGDATTIDTHVSVLPMDEEPGRGPGNVFAMREPQRLGPHAYNFEALWTEGSRLRIRHLPGVRVLRAKTRIGSARIEYAPW